MSEFVNNHRPLQQLLCLLICVCAWRGPVPVLHDHQSMRNSELQERHARTFHEGQEIDEIVGLHWHLGFPEDVTGEDCPARDEATSDLPLFACASAATSYESAETQSMQFLRNASVQPLELSLALTNRSPQRGATLPRTFLESLMCETPLAAVTGVCLI